MSKNELKRFGVSMESTLLDEFDKLIECIGYNNRSEAVRDLVRNSITDNLCNDSDKLIAGSIMFFYDHHIKDLMQEITSIQHQSHDEILSTTHFHLDHNNCMEIIVVKGNYLKLQNLANKLFSIKGVKYGSFNKIPL
jgi:CopG family nickel-responsive transcriptional regulator